MKARIIQVDAFTDEPFKGNPAGVCLLHERPTDSWMQSVAMEMNLSETAFVWPKNKEYGIRYFTPVREVPLCGHATLSSAHVLWEDRLVPQSEKITFRACDDTFHARREEGWICFDYPAYTVVETKIPDGLEDAIGKKPCSTWKGGLGGYLLELDSEPTIRGLEPDMTNLREGKYGQIIATARSDSKSFDFVSRFFWPEAGIDEDPVTGAAHCSLGPFWSKRLHKTDLLGFQASRRGGMVRVRVREDRVDILGHAVTIFRGEMAV